MHMSSSHLQLRGRGGGAVLRGRLLAVAGRARQRGLRGRSERDAPRSPNRALRLVARAAAAAGGQAWPQHSQYWLPTRALLKSKAPRT